MTHFRIHIPGQGPRDVGPAEGILSFGRASGNDVQLDDASISRSHARLVLRQGVATLEDLGSHNGTCINGARIHVPTALNAGDMLMLGTVCLRVEALEPTPLPGGSQGTSLFMRVDHLRSLQGGAELSSGRAWQQALAIVHDVSLELLKDGTLEALLEGLALRLFEFLRPGRVVILLRDGAGRLRQVAAQTRRACQEAGPKLSQTMLEAVLERREAMLVNDVLHDEALGRADSLVGTGIVSLMAVPLEHDGWVDGLVYLDADFDRERFSEEDLRLVASLAHLAAAKIQNDRLVAEVIKKRELEREMALARQIQERLLPEGMPDLLDYEMFGFNVACRQVSGDLYGHWIRPDGRLWLALADVSGKGVGPGLLMAAFQAYLQAWSETEEDPAALALKLSLALSRNTAPNRFVTAFLALLDPAAQTLTWTNAGHNPALLLSADGGVASLEPSGFPLAMFAGTSYVCQTFTLQPGDMVALYSDGITEAADVDGEDFGPEALAAILRTHAQASLPDIYAALASALAAHTQGAPLADDRTVLLLRRKWRSPRPQEASGHHLFPT